MKLRGIQDLAPVWTLLAALMACSVLPFQPSHPLDGTRWVLQSYEGTEPIPGSTITAVFEDGRIQGSSGCNSYGGDYRTNGRRIEFSNVNVTLMGCLDPEGVMEQEQAFLTALGDAQRYEITGGELRLTQSNGQMLIFRTQG